MTMLTQQQITLLVKILKGGGLHPAGEDALRFRANNADALDDLDKLERLGFIARPSNKYRLLLVALVQLRPKYPDADSLYHLCSHIFHILQGQYKKKPGEKIRIEHLAIAADLPESEIRRGLSCLLAQAQMWAIYEGMPDSIVTITPSENILRYRDLDEVVHQLLEQQTRSATGDENREKQQKFGVLDSPTLLAPDLARPSGALGRAVLYLDLDDFKKINTQLTESKVDKHILPFLHKALTGYAEYLGFAYGEGGDEFTILLRNATRNMAVEFAQEVRLRIAALRFEDPASDVQLTVSIGISYGAPGEDGQPLKDRANIAKKFAKDNGKNCVALWAETGSQVV